MKVALIAPAVAFILPGAFITWWADRKILLGAQSTRWPTVEGTIVELGWHRGAAGIRDDTEAVINYRYVVNGATYECDVHDHQGLARIAERPDMLQSFHIGDRITVYYDPTAPQRAVLVPGVGQSSREMRAVGIVATVVGIAILVYAFLTPVT